MTAKLDLSRPIALRSNPNTPIEVLWWGESGDAARPLAIVYRASDGLVYGARYYTAEGFEWGGEHKPILINIPEPRVIETYVCTDACRPDAYLSKNREGSGDRVAKLIITEQGGKVSVKVEDVR